MLNKKVPKNPQLSFALRIAEDDSMLILYPREVNQAALRAVDTLIEDSNLCNSFVYLFIDFSENPKDFEKSKAAVQGFYKLLKEHADLKSPVSFAYTYPEVLQLLSRVLSADKSLSSRLAAVVDRVVETFSQSAVIDCVELILTHWEDLYRTAGIYQLLGSLCIISERNVLVSVGGVNILLNTINKIYYRDSLQKKSSFRSKIKAAIRKVFEEHTEE